MFARLTLARRFMLASIAVLLTAMLGLGAWVGGQIKTGVINRSGATTALYVDSFIAPLLQELGWAQAIAPQHIDTLNTLLRDTSFGREILAFKVWDLNGRVVYSTDPAAVGQTFPMSAALLRASQGEVSTRASFETEENATQRQINPELLEIYSPVRRAGTNQVIAVAEYYQSMDALAGEIRAAQRRSWLVVAGVMAVIFLLLFGFVRDASNTIERQQQRLNEQIARLTELLAQNLALSERVRRAAASVATLNESFLRRVGADLHDGPAQHLGLALLQIDRVMAQFEQEPPPKYQAEVEQFGKIQALLGETLKEMRAIAAGLALPELEGLTPAEAITRAARAHERRTGTRVELDLQDAPADVPLPVKITAYRLAQEALNNAYRHAGGAGQSVTVGRAGDTLVVTVSDQGPGLPEAGALPDGRLGLAGMRERVESLGGTFQAEGREGGGTRITARLPLQLEREPHGE